MYSVEAQPVVYYASSGRPPEANGVLMITVSPGAEIQTQIDREASTLVLGYPTGAPVEGACVITLAAS
jgi:hypothetical protein